MKGYKIKEKSATSRTVATCCNSAMYLSVDGWAHWVSVCRARIQGDAPPLQMRIQTKFKSDGSMLPNDVPSYPTFPVKFLAKLVAARIAMLFHR